MLYHCRQIAITVDQLQAEWDKLASEEKKLEASGNEDAEIVKVRIENERIMVVDAVEEAITAMQELIDSLTGENEE